MTSKVFGNGVDGIHYDIVSYLMDVISNQALASLAPVCKSIYNLAEPKLVVRKLSVVSMADLIRPLQIMNEISKPYRAFDLIKIIEFEQWMRTQQWLHTHQPLRRDKFGRYFMRRDPFEEHLLEQIRLLPFLSGAIKEQLANTIGLHGFFIVEGLLILLMLCPNAKEVRYQGDLDALCLTTHDIISYLYIEDSPPHKSPNSSLPFLKLDKITLSTRNLSANKAAENYEFRPTCLSPESLLSLSSIPSLRQLTICKVLVAANMHEIRGSAMQDLLPSNVEHILLEQCTITTGALKFLVKRLPRLKSFRMTAPRLGWIVNERIHAAYTDSTAARETWPNESVEDISGYANIISEEQRIFVRGLKHVAGPTLEARNLRIKCCKDYPLQFPHLTPEGEPVGTVVISA